MNNMQRTSAIEKILESGTSVVFTSITFRVSLSLFVYKNIYFAWVAEDE